jgi:hypothetical protein
MIKVNLQTLEATRAQLPDFLYGLTQDTILDLSWADQSLGVSGFGWWPEDVQTPPIDESVEKYGDEILVADQASKTVVVTRDVIQLSAPEIAAKKQEIITAKLIEIDRLAKSKRDSIVADYSPGEMASWPIKRGEALAYQSAMTPSDAIAPSLAVEAAIRGISTAALVGKVLANSEILTGLEAAIAGNAGKHRDAVSVMTATAARNYDISTGWPI